MRCSGDSTAKTVWPRSEFLAALLHLLADDHEVGEHEPAEQEARAFGVEDARHG